MIAHHTLVLLVPIIITASLLSNPVAIAVEASGICACFALYLKCFTQKSPTDLVLIATFPTCSLIPDWLL